jgi:hypothetical protein
MDVKVARTTLEQYLDQLRGLASEMGCDKAFDAFCAASVSWGVVSAVRAAGKVAGKGSLRFALAHLGAGAGVAGGVLTVAGIALSTYIATDAMMVELGNTFVDTLLAQGVPVDDAIGLIDRIPLSRALTDSMRQRAGAPKRPIEIDCEVE